VAATPGINIKRSLDSLVNYIKKGLKSNLPVALLIGFNSKCDYQKHWITMTMIYDDTSTSTRKVTVGLSTWGKYAYMNFVRYYNGISMSSIVDELEYFK